MKNKVDKPKMSSSQLIYQKCAEKGITFKYISQKQAISYIQEKNNFLRMMSYRKNYRKHEVGKGNSDHYINLDFAYLYELSIIDMHLRNIVSRMCSDIEHSLKVSLVAAIEKDINQDGYTIVENYINSMSSVRRKGFLDNLVRKSFSAYTGLLMKKNFKIENPQERRCITTLAYDDCPAWVFVEILTFGEFIDFLNYCADLNLVATIDNKILRQTKSLRNACAHNNCLLVDLKPQLGNAAPRKIFDEILQIEEISKKQRTKKLRNRFLAEFTSLIYTYSKVVDVPVKTHRVRELNEFLTGRMLEKKAFFLKNEILTSAYDFVVKIVNHFFLLKGS